MFNAEDLLQKINGQIQSEEEKTASEEAQILYESIARRLAILNTNDIMQICFSCYIPTYDGKLTNRQVAIFTQINNEFKRKSLIINILVNILIFVGVIYGWHLILGSNDWLVNIVSTVSLWIVLEVSCVLSDNTIWPVKCYSFIKSIYDKKLFKIMAEENESLNYKIFDNIPHEKIVRLITRKIGTERDYNGLLLAHIKSDLKRLQKITKKFPNLKNLDITNISNDLEIKATDEYWDDF